MSEDKRYISIVLDELYYTIDIKGLKTLTDFINEIKEEYLEEGYTIDDIEEIAGENYNGYLYEHSLSGSEVEALLNTYEQKTRELYEQIELLNKIILRQSEQIKQLNFDKEV